MSLYHGINISLRLALEYLSWYYLIILFFFTKTYDAENFWDLTMWFNPLPRKAFRENLDIILKVHRWINRVANIGQLFQHGNSINVTVSIKLCFISKGFIETYNSWSTGMVGGCSNKVVWILLEQIKTNCILNNGISVHISKSILEAWLGNILCNACHTVFLLMLLLFCLKL